MGLALAVRMKQHCANAMTVAAWLAGQPKVQRVYYPGLPGHPQHALASKQMCGFGGMISSELRSPEATRSYLKGILLCAIAESLRGVETIITHPASMTHAAIPPGIRQQMGVTDGLVRISVGLEDVEDILADIETALKIPFS
jgi:cystathionine beta-lyase/cystathionine gamma-synthase